ncbi:unnamed protein product [Discula destructiva]
MCKAHYCRYAGCDHSVIEVREPCRAVLWRAGLTGELSPCKASIFKRSDDWSGLLEDEPPKETLFVGNNGFCDACIKNTLPWLSGDARQEDPSHDHNYDADARDVRLPPCFQLNQVTSTFSTLLGLEDHNVGNMEITFPGFYEELSWKSFRKHQSYKVAGIWNRSEGKMTAAEALCSLKCPDGFSEEDRATILSTMYSGNVHDLYNARFKDRGMPSQVLDAYCARLLSSRGKIINQEQANANDSTAEERSNPPSLDTLPGPQQTQADADTEYSASDSLPTDNTHGNLVVEPSSTNLSTGHPIQEPQASPLNQPQYNPYSPEDAVDQDRQVPSSPDIEIGRGSARPLDQSSPLGASRLSDMAVQFEAQRRAQTLEPQHTETVATAAESRPTPRVTAAMPLVYHQEEEVESSQNTRGTKRSFDLMDTQPAESGGVERGSRQSDSGYTPSRSSAQRRRLHQSVDLSPLNPQATNTRENHAAQSITSSSPISSAAHAPRNSPGSLLLAAAVTRAGTGATSNLSSNGSPLTPSRAVGLEHVATWRNRQSQALASQAVSLEASPEVLQNMQMQTQMAQARHAPSPTPRPPTLPIDAYQARSRQVQARRERAPSVRAENLTRREAFRAAYAQSMTSRVLHHEESGRGNLEAAINEEILDHQSSAVDQSALSSSDNLGFIQTQRHMTPDYARSNSYMSNNLQSIAQSPTGQPLSNVYAGGQSTFSQSIINPAMVPQGILNPSLSSASPLNQSPARSSAAIQSTGPQEYVSVYWEVLPEALEFSALGHGVLPHAVFQAGFFKSHREQGAAYHWLEQAWAYYRRETPDELQQKAIVAWEIVNFTSNFKLKWAEYRDPTTGGNALVCLSDLKRHSLRVPRPLPVPSSTGQVQIAQSLLVPTESSVGFEAARQQHTTPERGNAEQWEQMQPAGSLTMPNGASEASAEIAQQDLVQPLSNFPMANDEMGLNGEMDVSGMDLTDLLEADFGMFFEPLEQLFQPPST